MTTGTQRKSGLLPMVWQSILIIIICSLISWALVWILTAPKSSYLADISRIDTTLGHMQDMETGLNNLANSQSTRLDNIDSKADKIQNDLTGLKTQTESDISKLKTQTDSLTAQSTQLSTQLSSTSKKADDTAKTVDTLKTKVDSIISGLQITPQVSGNTISLSIKSDSIQQIAFRIEFRPTYDMVRSETSLEAALKALYTTPPITVIAGTIAVRGDYVLYWSGNYYHVARIVFITPRTQLSAGTQTKNITCSVTSGYEILITPEYPTGATTGSW